jgi:hypothetical protein
MFIFSANLTAFVDGAFLLLYSPKRGNTGGYFLESLANVAIASDYSN